MGLLFWVMQQAPKLDLRTIAESLNERFSGPLKDVSWIAGE